MIAGSNGDRSGDTRPLWITGLSPPDSWRSLRQPGYLQLDQVRHPKHRVWGYDRTLKVRNISIDKSGKFSVAIDNNLALATAIVKSTLRRDGNGNPGLDRATSRGRIDVLSAAVIAAGLAEPMFDRPPRRRFRFAVAG